MKPLVISLLREPLCQFLFLGGMIFVLHAWLQNDAGQSQELYQIEVTEQQRDALHAAFIAENGRPATEAELHIRLQQWLDEQMLYRQALALGLDKRDAIVRRQMVQKMRFLLADSHPVAEPTTDDLQAWLDTHPQRYGHSPRLSFQQVYLSRSMHGKNLNAAARKIQQQLQQHPDAFVGLGDAFPSGQTLLQVDTASLRRSFGQDFTAQISQMPDDVWSGPIVSGLGLHWVRITARQDFVPAQLADVRQQVEQDWRLYQREVANAAAMQEVRDQFEVIYSDASQAESG